jgi:hypothetical protein
MLHGIPQESLMRTLLCVLLVLSLGSCAGSRSGDYGSSGGASGSAAQPSQEQRQRLRSKVDQVRTQMKALQKSGRAPREVYAEMQQVKPLLDAGKIDEAEAVVDRALATLAAGATAPAPAPPSRAPAGRPDRPLFAMIPGAPDGDPSLVPSAFNLSRDVLGAELLYWYVSYADLAKNGGNPFVMQSLAKGGRTAINFGIVHTTVQGKYPKPWKSFTDSGFAAAFAQAAADFAKRNRPDYIFIGNEANTYLAEHRDEAPAYEELVRRTREAVHRAEPATRVGVVISFRDAEKKGQWPLVKRLAQQVDLIGYTVYGYEDPGFRFGVPADGLRWLERLPEGVPGKPYAVVETGWNSAAVLDSNEAEQAEFARLFVRHLATTRAEFVTWFLFQDGKDCSRTAKSFLGPFAGIGAGKQIEIFKAFLCNFGLRRNDGTPKPAWEVFASRPR